MKYILNWNLLQKCDVIIIKTNTGGFDTLMRKYSISDFSHVMLYNGNGSVRESEGLGVRAWNIQRFCFDNKDDVVVRRRKKLTEEEKNAILVFANTRIGMEYDGTEMRKVRHQQPEEKKGNPNGEFCSRYVARAYANANIKLVSNIDFCTPDEIRKSVELEDVKDVLREATEEEVKYAQSESILDDQSSSLASMLETINEIAGNLIYSESDIIPFVITHQNFDEQIAEVLKKSDFFQIWKKYELTHNYEFDVSLFIKKFGKYSKQVALELLHSGLEISAFHYAIYRQLVLEYEKYQLKTLECYRDLYSKIVNMEYRRFKVFIEVSDMK